MWKGTSYRKLFRWGLCLPLIIGLTALACANYLNEADLLKTQPRDQNSEQPSFPLELAKIFRKPLSYLSEGNQCYVFLSQDGNYVIKFFKLSPLQPKSWLEFLPDWKWVKNRQLIAKEQATRKFNRLCNAYGLAYEKDRQNSGLEWLQLTETSQHLPTAVLKDLLGFKHTVNLNEVAFAIQQKAIPLNIALKKLLQADDLNAAKELLKKVLKMYEEGYRHGIIDQDHNLMHNVGVIDGHPIRMDVGKLTYDSSYTRPEVFQPDIEKIYQRITKWLNHYAKNYKDQLLLEIQ